MSRLFNVSALIAQRILEVNDTSNPLVIDYLNSLLDTISELESQYDRVEKEALRLNDLNQSLTQSLNATRSDVNVSTRWEPVDNYVHCMQRVVHVYPDGEYAYVYAWVDETGELTVSGTSLSECVIACDRYGAHMERVHAAEELERMLSNINC